MSKIKRILVKKEKHGTSYFDVSTPEDYEKALRTVFDDHDEQECYYNLKHEKAYRDYLLGFKTNLMILNDEKDLYRKHKRPEKVEQIAKQIEQMEKAEKFFRMQKDLYDKAIEGDIKAIKKLLDERQDYQYEGFDIETVRS